MNCLSFKTKDDRVLLNDKNRVPFSSISEPKFQKTLNLVEKYKHVTVSESHGSHD